MYHARIGLTANAWLAATPIRIEHVRAELLQELVTRGARLVRLDPSARKQNEIGLRDFSEVNVEAHRNRDARARDLDERVWRVAGRRPRLGIPRMTFSIVDELRAAWIKTDHRVVNGFARAFDERTDEMRIEFFRERGERTCRCTVARLREAREIEITAWRDVPRQRSLWQKNEIRARLREKRIDELEILGDAVEARRNLEGRNAQLFLQTSTTL